jgi:hypothetical protein
MTRRGRDRESLERVRSNGPSNADVGSVRDLFRALRGGGPNGGWPTAVGRPPFPIVLASPIVLAWLGQVCASSSVARSAGRSHVLSYVCSTVCTWDNVVGDEPVVRAAACATQPAARLLGHCLQCCLAVLSASRRQGMKRAARPVCWAPTHNAGPRCHLRSYQLGVARPVPLRIVIDVGYLPLTNALYP